jgi:hypothetical protein
VPWKRGVKQGCPLSPLLFNFCIEPLLQAITKECGEFGAQIDPTDEQIQLVVQAHADDVIFIPDNPNGVTKMLKVLENFVDWSKMEVNVKKCATASYLKDIYPYHTTPTHCHTTPHHPSPIYHLQVHTPLQAYPHSLYIPCCSIKHGPEVIHTMEAR